MISWRVMIKCMSHVVQNPKFVSLSLLGSHKFRCFTAMVAAFYPQILPLRILNIPSYADRLIPTSVNSRTEHVEAMDLFSKPPETLIFLAASILNLDEDVSLQVVVQSVGDRLMGTGVGDAVDRRRYYRSIIASAHEACRLILKVYEAERSALILSCGMNNLVERSLAQDARYDA